MNSFFPSLPLSLSLSLPLIYWHTLKKSKLGPLTRKTLMHIRIFLSHFETLSNLINAPQNIFDLLMGKIGTDYDECLLGDVNESLLGAECVFPMFSLLNSSEGRAQVQYPYCAARQMIELAGEQLETNHTTVGKTETDNSL